MWASLPVSWKVCHWRHLEAGLQSSLFPYNLKFDLKDLPSKGTLLPENWKKHLAFYDLEIVVLQSFWKWLQQLIFDRNLTLPVENSKQAGFHPEGGESAGIGAHVHPIAPSSMTSPLSPGQTNWWASPVDRGSHIPGERQPDGKPGRRSSGFLCRFLGNTHHPRPTSHVSFPRNQTHISEWVLSIPGHKFPFHHPPKTQPS